MSREFAKLVESIEEAGIKGHDAYELANQVDKSAYNCQLDAEIKQVGKDVAADEMAMREALVIL